MIYFWILLISLLGAHVTYWLSHHTKMGAIRASALSTLVFVAVTSPFSFLILAKLQAAYFGATFVGMSDASRLGEKRILLAAVIFGAIFSFLLRFRGGIGGTLGASAFVACLLVYGLSQFSSARAADPAEVDDGPADDARCRGSLDFPSCSRRRAISRGHGEYRSSADFRNDRHAR